MDVTSKEVRHDEIKARKREKMKLYREQHREELLEKRHEYARKNRERINELARIRRAKNIDESRRKAREYRHRTREKRLENQRKYVAGLSDEVKEKRKQQQREYRQKNLERLRAYDRERSKDPKRKQQARDDYARNAEKRREAKRKEYIDNPEKIRNRNNAYYAKTKDTRGDRYRELNRKNYHAHPERTLAHQKEVRDQKRAAFLAKVKQIMEKRGEPPDTNPVGVIYKIENIMTHRVYIGQTTVPLSERYSQPFYAQEEKQRNARVVEDLNTYGSTAFAKPRAIYVCYSRQELDIAEAYFIDKFKSVETGYNILHGIRTNRPFEPRLAAMLEQSDIDIS